MRAVVLHEWGGPLTLESVPDPAPGIGEVVLRVHACAPDQFDVTIRAGRIGGKLPLIMGHEIAGEVAALGPGVEGWAEGDRAILVKGTDTYRHFEMIPRPQEEPGQAERELARLHGRTRHKALMED